jgi:ribonuclease P/MRP protein subunit POP7
MHAKSNLNIASQNFTTRSYHDYQIVHSAPVRASEPQSNHDTDTQITKRPLLRPAIPSPYSGSQNQKVVYINAKTPFLSAVKRAEKLLHLADKRLVQSATTITKQGKTQSYGKRKRGAAGAEEDEILDIAETVEKLKRRKTDGKAMENEGEIESGTEEVMLKATGKAIQKCLELGLWFQQREEYRVRLETRSVAAIDDISVDKDEVATVSEAPGEIVAVDDGAMQVDDDTAAGADEDRGAEKDNGLLQTSNDRDGKDKQRKKTKEPPGVETQVKGHIDVPESRIRYASSLEVFVSLR